LVDAFVCRRVGQAASPIKPASTGKAAADEDELWESMEPASPARPPTSPSRVGSSRQATGAATNKPIPVGASAEALRQQREARRAQQQQRQQQQQQLKPPARSGPLGTSVTDPTSLLD